MPIDDRDAPPVELPHASAEFPRLAETPRSALREAEERFRLTIDNAPIGMALVALDGTWVHVNPRVCEIVGYSAEELRARTFQDVTHPEDLETDLALVGALLRGEIPRYELPKRYIRKDGSIAEALLHVSLLRDEDGEPRQFISQIIDVTERNRLQARVAFADRMAAIGTLASGIGHEINNPLTYVLLNLGLLRRDLEQLARDPSPARIETMSNLLEDARSGAERVRKIVQGLRTFAHAPTEERGPVDVRAAIESALRLVQNEIRLRARLVTEFVDVPAVHADEPRLVQVFVNLLINAAQAIPEGSVEANEIRVTLRASARERVLIEVRDTGRGIPVESMSRVFDPFYTTKDVGQGTGLGLSITHAIVTSLGGEIAASSVEGGGTLFRVSLPASSDASAAIVAPPAAQWATLPSRPRVLLVDDEETLLASLVVVLEQTFDVTAVSNGRDALGLIDAGERYDVILCDVMMAVVSGRQVYERLAEVAPDQAERIVFATGGAFTASAQTFLDAVPNARIDKPFNILEVRELLGAFLDARGLRST